MPHDLSEFITSFVLHIVNIVVLFFILRKLLFKPVHNFMTERTKSYQEKEDALKDKENTLTKQKEEYEHKMESAKTEAREIIANANEQSKKLLAEEHEIAMKKSEEIISRGRRQVEAEREQTLQELKEETAKLAVDISAKILSREVTEEDNKEIIDTFLERVK